MKISIIVPLYKGKKYLKAILNQVKQCASVEPSIQIELVIFNDYPPEYIEVDSAEYDFEIQVINSSKNQGIHGARVAGINYASGSYIWILDQDDLVNKYFLKSQLRIIREEVADAVVCRAIRENRQVYDTVNSFSKIIDLNHMITEGNYIVSPGQVLIRKDALPEMWKSNVMKINGADDWFLWICMLNSGCKFALNEDILYEHIENGSNVSANTCQMFESENEMLQIIKQKHILDERKLRLLEQCVCSVQRRQISLLDKFRRMFFVYDEWMQLNSTKKNFSSYLKKMKMQKISIYGMGYIGKRLAQELHANGLDFVYGIDRNADYISDEFAIQPFVDCEKEVDLYIVTVIEEPEKICAEIRRMTGVKSISFISLLEEVKND